MTTSKLRRPLAVLGAAAAVAGPSLASAQPPDGHGQGGHERGAGHGKGPAHRPAKRTPVVTYVFKGKVARVAAASTVVVAVHKVNRHGRALRGRDVAFDVTAAQVVVRDVNGDGRRDLADVAVGDRVQVLARLPKRLAGALSEPVAAKGLIVKPGGGRDPYRPSKP